MIEITKEQYVNLDGMRFVAKAGEKQGDPVENGWQDNH